MTLIVEHIDACFPFNLGCKIELPFRKQDNLKTIRLYLFQGGQVKEINCCELKDHINSSSVIFQNGAILGIKIETC